MLRTKSFNSPPPPQPRSILWILIPLAFGVRLIYDTARQLVPDEAFYWVLSRHPAMGYLDHPPMVAYLIRLGTLLFGFNELGVRAVGSLLAFAAVVVLVAMCRRTRAGERGTVLLGVIWLCSPLFAGIATLMTPDTPMIFFSVCAMAVAVGIARRVEVGENEDGGLRMEDGAGSSAPSAIVHPPSSFSLLRLWIGFGLLTGLAMLSKYTAVLPAGAVAAAMLTSRAGRAQLRTAGPWLALLVAAAVFSPVVYWNAKHGWASFRFQLHHGLDVPADEDAGGAGAAPAGPALGARFASLGVYLLGQIGFYTPVFFIFGVVVVAIRWREYARLGLGERVLTWSATVPLVFFGLAAFKSATPGEGNWPAFGYFPMSLLMLAHVARRWKPFDVKWLKIGAGMALAITVALHSPDLLAKALREHFPRKLNEFYGWREMGRSVANQVQQIGPVLIVAGRHQDAAELSFYMPGQPEVWVINAMGRDGKAVSRPTAYDYFDDRPDVREVPRLIYFWGHADDFCRTYDFVTAGLKWNWLILLHGQERERKYELLVNKWGPGQRPATTTTMTTTTTR